jgi:hypothetical protein
MQSSAQVKKLKNYKLGERVYEGDYYAGRVASIYEGNVSGYLLLVNDREEYTIYRGENDSLCSLSLTRNIPEPVAIQFAQVIIGGKELPVVPIEREPVKQPVKTPVKKPVQKIEPEPDSSLSFYFDFV